MITSALRHPVLPYIDTSTQAPGTIQPAPLPDPGQLDPRRAKVVDDLLGKVSDKIRKRMQTIMQPIPTGELEALYKHGLRFDITVEPSAAQKAMSGGLQMLGGYSPMNRKIQFMESTLLSDLGPHTVIHEMCHAIDHMRGERISKTPNVPLLGIAKFLSGRAMESGRSTEIRALYHRYQARSNVEDIDVMRREIELKNGRGKPLPEKVSFISDFDHWGLRPVNYERKDGVETFTIQPTVKARNKRLAHAAIGGVLVAGGLALPAVLGPAALAVGGIMLGVAAIGQARSMLHKFTAPKTEVDIPMVGKKQAHVVQQDERAVVTCPEGARSYTGDTWSDYAHRGSQGQEFRGAAEYTAEAYSTYLEGGDKAQRFKDDDPEMYSFVETRLREEFNLNP